MQSLFELARQLRHRLLSLGVTQGQLSEQAGLSRRTLSSILSGTADFRVTTLMAILDRLGLELVVLPKEAASGLADMTSSADLTPAIKTRVQAANEALQGRLNAERDKKPD